MRIELSLQPVAFHADRPSLPGGEPLMYEVLGMPPGRRAYIALANHRWRVMQVENGSQTDWEGDHLTAEDALEALGRTVGTEPSR